MKHLLLVLSLVCFVSTATAGDKPPEDAEKSHDECSLDAGGYAHGALQYFHNMLCLGNKRFAGMAEEVFYHLVVDMAMDVTTTELPADGSTVALTGGTFKTRVIAGTAQKVVAPDSFAGTYDNRVKITVDGVQSIDFRWSGKGKESKGFLIMIPTAMRAGATEKGLVYIRWDRTTAAQTIDALGTKFTTSYLGSVTDRAIYYKAAFNNTTKVVEVQVVTIEPSRAATAALACYMMYGTGTLGAAMRVGKTKQSLSTTGHPVTETDKDVDSALFDDWEGTDTKTEANGGGNGTAVDAFAFNYACADLNGASATGKPFVGNTVNFSITATEVTTMFARQP